MIRFLLLCLLLLFQMLPAENTEELRKEQRAPLGFKRMEKLFLEKSVGDDYVLGPGDLFRIVAEFDDDQFQIGPSGDLLLGELGIVALDGKTLAEARELIITLLEKKYRRNSCFVQLLQVKEFLVYVTGEVLLPGSYRATTGLRVNTLISMAKGMTRASNQEKVLLLRKGDTLVLDQSAFERKGKLDQNPEVLPGDLIFVPRFDFVAKRIVVQGSEDIRFYPWNEDWSVQDYLDRFGNYTSNLVRMGVRIVKNGQRELSREVAEDEMRTFRPDPGDVIELVNLRTRVYVGGAVAAPGSFTYMPGLKARDYLSQAGILPITASESFIFIVRRDGQLVSDAAQLEVFPGDRIEITKSTYESFKDFILFLGSLSTIVFTIVLIDAQLTK